MYVMGIEIRKNFDMINILNAELTFYLAIVAIIPLFDMFEKLQKIKVNSFKSELDVFIESIVLGFILVFIIYFLLAINFINPTLKLEKISNMMDIIFNLILYYFYILNLIILFIVIKKFLYNVRNSNLK